ncbi:unnamed protein product [Cladocopium goreaui]|uniref:ABC transmembrane type-1 domain-containing protein n=1 Tax=Cladocopium goreaui TaxID=2562237 RepID=A0A9P1CNN2_9DINO|nr:unnamed protein product [Cladocopium goreaui]
MQTVSHAERQALEAFKSEQAAMAWLAEQSEVAAALDLAESGEEEKAVVQLAEAVQELLFAGEDQRIEPAAKCRRVEAGEDASPAEALPTGAKEAEVAPAARCVCIVLAGMRGSGKTTLCSVLQKVIGGEHIHFDEITKTWPSQRRAFQSSLKKALTKSLSATKSEKRSKGLSGTSPQEVADESEDPFAPKKLSNEGDKLVYVDRTHLLSNQRVDIIAVLQKLRWRQRQCRTLLLEFNHSSDVFGYGADGQLSKRFSQNHITLCAERIEARRSAHPVLRPSAKLQGVLRKEAKAAEPPSPAELRNFDARLSLEVADSPVQQALVVVKELQRLGWLTTVFDSDALSLQVELAWQVYARAQDALRQGTHRTHGTHGTVPDNEKHERREWLAQCRQAAEEKAAAQAAAEAKRVGKAVCWRFDLPEVKQVLLQRGSLPACFDIRADTVVELLKLPADGDMERTAKEQGLEVDALEAMTDALEALQGETFEVRMTKIVISETMACALVALPPVVPHVGKVPHVILGSRQGVPLASVEDLLKQAEAKGSSVTCVDLPGSRPLLGRLIRAS